MVAPINILPITMMILYKKGRYHHFRYMVMPSVNEATVIAEPLICISQLSWLLPYITKTIINALSDKRDNLLSKLEIKDN